MEAVNFTNPDKENEEESLNSSSPLDESLYGEDAVSSSTSEAEKLAFGFSFSAQDGEAGNETEDYGDLPKGLRKPGHIYDPNLAEGTSFKKTDPNEITGSMHISKEEDAGLSYSDEDNYND